MAAQPCDVCGLPTLSKLGVCRRETPACVSEWHRRYYAANPSRREAKNRAYYDANRAAILKQVHDVYRATHEAPPTAPCEICGQPTVAKDGVCKQTQPCRNERQRRWRADHPEWVRARNLDYRAKVAVPAPLCDVCGQPMRRSKHGVCSRTDECRTEQSRRSHAAALPARRERVNAQRQRADRPCRSARAGCTAFAQVGEVYCREHRNAALRRRRRRRLGRLAARQGSLCPWCSRPLPADLAGVHVDHVIPAVAGGPDIDANIQILHAACNLAKADQITPAARELAAVLGIELLSAA